MKTQFYFSALLNLILIVALFLPSVKLEMRLKELYVKDKELDYYQRFTDLQQQFNAIKERDSMYARKLEFDSLVYQYEHYK